MRKLPCYPAKAALGSGFAKTGSQDCIRSLSMREHQQCFRWSIVRYDSTSSCRGINDSLHDKTSRNISQISYVVQFSERDGIQSRSKRCNPMLKFIPTLKPSKRSVTLIADKYSPLTISGHLLERIKNRPSTEFRRFLGSLSESHILYSHRLGSSRFIAPQMSSSAHDGAKNNNKYEPREITFKTSFGQIACLEWGQRSAPNKILCLHGWLDNAGSFEPLIPFILKHRDNYSKYHVIAMDMPGVGHSSHRPVGAEYTTFSNVIEMRRITLQLGWDQNLTLMAHSLGGHLSFLYSCVYPKQVSTLISIDTTHPLTRQAVNWQVTIANSIEHYFKCENYSNQNDKLDSVVPVYTEDEAIKRLMEGHNNSLTLESAKVLFKRGATRHPNGGCTFNRDIRLRHLSVEFRPDEEQMFRFLENSFKPKNLLILRAMRSPYFRPEEERLRYYGLFERNCGLFRDTMLDGTHHLHLNTPDLVAGEINRFLEDAEMANKEAELSRADNSATRPLVSKPNL